MQEIIYSAHQSSFMPWVGFWNKVYEADIFDISIFNQFTKKTWQHYSFIGSPNEKIRWGLKLQDAFAHKSYTFQINQIKVEKGFSSRLLSEFEKVHQSDRHFNDIFPLLINWLESVDKLDSLWLINFTLLNILKDFLCIDTPFIVSPPDKAGNPTLNIIENVLRYNCNVYFSGPHGPCYLEEDLFPKHNVALKLQNTTRLYKEYPLSLPSTISLYGIKKTLELIKNEFK